MHNYKGNLRREQDNTPTKSSFEQTRQNPQPPRYDPRNDSRFEQKPESRYDSRNEIKNESRYDAKENRYDTRYEKSELSYYQSQSSKVYYDHEREDRPSGKSQAALLDDKYCYNSVLPVLMRPNERDQHEQRVRVVIQAKAEKGINQLQIFLTDDSNPKFLWSFSVKQVDFMTLKNSQKLKVSFAGFPEMLQNCLRDCQQSQNRSNFLVLQTRKGEGKLQFLESGKYRVTNYLELSFKSASDQEIKDYLSVKMLAAAEEIQQNRKNLRQMEYTLSERMKELQRKHSELNTVLAQRDQLKEQFKLEINQKKTELQSIKLNELTKTKKEAELQLKDLKQRLTAQIDALSKQKNDLSNRLAEARERVATLQASERQQSIKILRLQQDSSKGNKECEQLRGENRQLSQRRFQNEKTITELSCKIESLRSELEDKKTIITSTVQLKETNNSQISSLQQLTNDQKKQIAKLQQKIAELEGENGKLISVQNELQEKLARQKEKLQQRGQIIKDQQKQLKDLNKRQATLQRDNQKLQYEKEQRDNRIKTLQDQLDKMQKKFEEEQAMVLHLQKSLNQRPGLRTNYYPPPPSYQSSTSYINRDPSQLSTSSNIANSRTLVTSTQRPERTEKYEPNIKRYEERSKSPLQSRLPQQKEPEDDDEGYSQRPTKFQKPIPVKFKMSQPKQP